VHVTSHTANPADLTAYGLLSNGSGRHFLLRWKGNGIAEVSELIGGTPVKIADRTAAEKLTNVRLFIDRAALPAPDASDEFYLADLIGLRAEDKDGGRIGTVTIVHDYGAGASLEIEPPNGGEPLILPFTKACVPVVDPVGGRVVVTPPDEVVVAPSKEGAAA
jgi:16S rRNA processing protein RimM